MVLTRDSRELADAILTSRPGKTLAKKIKSLKLDAQRHRKHKLNKREFLKATKDQQKNTDIKGFDDGKTSLLANHLSGGDAVIKEDRRLKAAAKKPIIKKVARAASLIKGRSTKKGDKNKGTVHAGKRRVHTKEI